MQGREILCVRLESNGQPVVTTVKRHDQAIRTTGSLSQGEPFVGINEVHEGHVPDVHHRPVATRVEAGQQVSILGSVLGDEDRSRPRRGDIWSNVLTLRSKFRDRRERPSGID